ncbi:hypothetical protein [Vibrio sp. 99-8-1]|uniref:hypothetical protein n=1 Tax=Vibrio sp. 99-8-1 TaxID=2607602 RepID=UPI00149345A4|nr:hypothetical protein [Vibrio sp. 99-8-1]NOI66926.1 hypothetical protein [Vibrio sp. 99-8-1]
MNGLKSQHISLNGTIDLVTPPIAKKSGNAIVADNVQPKWGGGFGRIEGVEPIDGASPASDYSYYRVVLKGDVSIDWVGRIFTLNGNSGVITGVELDSQSLRVAAISFELIGEALASISPDISVTATRIAPFGFGSNAEEQARYLAEAHKVIMDKVTPPLGSGVLRGVVELDYTPLIAFRDNGDRCAVSIAQENHNWQAAPATYKLMLGEVSNPALFVEGATIVIGATSRVLIASAFSADGQSGHLILDGEVTDVSGSDVKIDNQLLAKSTSVSTENALTSGRSWTFIYHNFYASSTTRYAYGTNGKEVIEVRPNGVIVPIMINDSREITDIEEHKNHLFLSFVGGQYGHCVVGEPLNWQVLLGAEQFGTGDEITALQSLVGNYLLVGCKHAIYLLSGTTKDDWKMSALNTRIGVTAGTLTSTFIPIAHSRYGFINVQQTQAYGDFVASELSANELLGDAALKEGLTQFFAHSHNRDNNQVRFYQKGANKHVVIQLLKDGKTRATFFKYHKVISDVWDTVNNTYLAFDDGRIYRQTTKVHSFAGSDIFWAIRFAYIHCGSPKDIKSWEDLELHMSSEGSLTLKYTHSLDYGSPNQAQSNSTVGVAFGGGGRWNESTWNDFYWSSPDYITPAAYLDGHSKNISILLSGKSNFEANFQLDGYSISYIPRRRFRV